MTTVIETNHDNVRIIQLNHENRHNPFSKELESAVIAALQRADADENVEALVVHGGADRSFSAGGDFNEVSKLVNGNDIDAWIDRVTDLYSAVLRVRKPTVAAIGGVAIGMGFQFGMMFDWRVMADSAELVMPELSHGIGCSVGAAILQELTAWNVMRDVIYRCEKITAQRALQYALVNDIAGDASLIDSAIKAARMLAGYPQVAFQNTKRVVNARLLERLIESAAGSKDVHRAAFTARDAQRHFQSILKEKYKEPV